MNQNIAYQTPDLARYFATNRVQWPQFYESERRVIERLNLGAQHSVLDIGCGCGGLGLALRDRFGLNNYTGVEINPAAAEVGAAMNPQATILCGDILDLRQTRLQNRRFAAVFSLSCVDWNVEFSKMLAVAWSLVEPGGHLIATFRLTDDEGCSDLASSYQYINYNGALEGEIAAYVVLNARDLMERLVAFEPSRIDAYGYWGPPSKTAITPFTTLCFAAVSLAKRNNDTERLRAHLELPEKIKNLMQLA